MLPRLEAGHRAVLSLCDESPSSEMHGEGGFPASWHGPMNIIEELETQGLRT